ncbi:hypothetical protein [Spartinivicinus poritis]|uniref:Uncharacterized protein n=1 Tax=Spartinivicinus poritis TaxID=2994640 RepID=A0ABT5UFE3_9GAMM|nr:hypothetical protein [Spartinivicinus sp. A2-2]MDE1465100.1 hypothetical protein [Spartinivicinus sp. A2-2]
MLNSLLTKLFVVLCWQVGWIPFSFASGLDSIEVTLKLPNTWQLDSGKTIRHQGQEDQQLITVKLDKDNTALFAQKGQSSNMLAIAAMPRQGSTTALDYQKMIAVEGDTKLVKPAYEQNLAGHSFAVLELEEKRGSKTRYESSYVIMMGKWILEITRICYGQPHCLILPDTVHQLKLVHDK